MENKEVATINKDVKSLQKLAAIKIIDEVTFNKAGLMLKDAKAIKDKIKSVFDPMIKGARASLKLIQDEKDKHMEPVEEIEELLRKETSRYYDALEQKRLEEQRKADEAARKEQEKLQKAADKKMEKAAAKGKELVIEVPVVEAIQLQESSKGGLAFREVYKFEVTDASLVPREYLTPNLTDIGIDIRAAKGEITIPGIRVWTEKTTIVK